MNEEQPPPPEQTRGRLILPDTLLDIDSVPDAIDAYLNAGLRPILIHCPLDGDLCTCGKKHDRTKSGSSSSGKHPVQNNWQKQPADRDVIVDQLARLKFTPNLGVALGTQPIGGYIVAVDIDDAERFKVLEAELGPLPETPGSTSGRGRHLFFEIPAEIDLTRLVNVTGLGGEPGVDVKREGGQVVVAPSLHNSGKRYAWTRVGAIATLPMQWALQLVKAPDVPNWVGEYTPQTMNADKKARNRAEKYLEKAVIGEAAALARCGEGMRNNTLYRSAFKMFGYCAALYLGGRWQYVHDQLLSAARAAGLPEREARKTLESADKAIRDNPDFRLPVVFQNSANQQQHRPPPQAQKSPQEPSGESPPPPPPGDPTVGALTPNDRSSGGLPIIKVTTKTQDIADASIAALRADRNLYQRDKTLIFITTVVHQEQEVNPHEEETIPIEGNPQTNLATRPIINGKLSKTAIFHKWVESAGGFKEVKPPEDVVAYIHDCHEYPGIRPVVGIAETPLLRPDGVIVQTPGYDPKTRYVYLPNQKFPVVTDEMATQEQAQWAYSYLADVFCDFPYINPSHLAVPISGILTLVGRAAIRGSVPAHLFDASTRGSGKTLQTDAVATAVTGRGAPRMNYAPKDEEMEKVLAGYALKGSSFICLDNIPAMCPFGGGPLDRVLTARDDVDLRVLGHTDVPTLTWRALIMATGNNVTFRGDTARRVLMARLEPTEENPERRTKFKHNDLLAYVRVQRPRLVAAALLILRAYFRAGCPPMGCDRWGSFEEWSRLIPNAIVFAGGADPMKARPENDQDVDPEAQALSTLLGQLPNLAEKLCGNPAAGLAARTVIMVLYENPEGETAEWAVFEPLKEAIEILCRQKFGKSGAKPDPMALGFKLRSLRKRVIGGRRLAGEPDRNGTIVWHVEKVNSSV